MIPGVGHPQITALSTHVIYTFVSAEWLCSKDSIHVSLLEKIPEIIDVYQNVSISKNYFYPEHLEKFEIKMDCTPRYILEKIKSFP